MGEFSKTICLNGKILGQSWMDLEWSGNAPTNTSTLISKDKKKDIER